MSRFAWQINNIICNHCSKFMVHIENYSLWTMRQYDLLKAKQSYPSDYFRVALSGFEVRYFPVSNAISGGNALKLRYIYIQYCIIQHWNAGLWVVRFVLVKRTIQFTETDWLCTDCLHVKLPWIDWYGHLPFPSNDLLQERCKYIWSMTLLTYRQAFDQEQICSLSDVKPHSLWIGGHKIYYRIV